MKFCSKCGPQLVDEALICTGCGCMVEPTQAPKKPLPNNTPPKRNNTLYKIFNFAFAIVAMFCLFALICSIIYAHIRLYIEIDSARSNGFTASNFLYGSSSHYHTHDHHEYAYFLPNNGWAIIALISSFVSLAFGIVSFILALIKKLKIEKIFTSITRLVCGILLVLLSFFTLF